MEHQGKFIKPIILIIGFIALTISGLNWNIGIAAWIAPIFLLYFTKNSKWTAFIWFYIAMALSASLSKTAENLSGIFIIYITTGLSHGLIYCLPYIIEKFVVKKEDKFFTTFVFPSAVILIEFLLSLLLGIWGNASIAQYYNSSLIQISSVFGVYGISFLIAWLASTINWIIKHNFESRIIKKGLGIYILVFVSVIFYGQIRITFFQPKSETVKVSAIISEIDIHEKFEKMEDEIIELSKNNNLEIPDSIFSSLIGINSQIQKTNEALKNGAKIVVWNEISLILKQSQIEMLVQEIKEQCLNHNAYVLIAFLEKNNSELPKPFNNKSILITPKGKIAWEYLKFYPTPLERLIVNSGERKIPFIDSEYGRIGNVICADLDISNYIKHAAKNNIDVLLVPAYDWEEVTPYHSNMAAFSAIQYGLSIVRPNGKGIVGFFNYLGNPTVQINTLYSGEKIIYADIPIKSVTTIYSIIGNLLVYISILFLLFVLGLKIKSSAPNNV